MDYANQIIDAIQTIAQNEVAGLKFDKTIRASIIEVTDPSIGKYKVRYQNSSFYAYALDLKTYAKGANVYVVVPSSDFNKDPYIMGTVKKLGADFVEVLKMEDKMSLVGDNIISVKQGEEDVRYLSSYNSQEQTIYRQNSEDPYSIFINQQALEMYKQDSEYMMIGAKFTTSISEEQKIGSGDYGIRVVCKYWDSRYKSKEDVPSNAEPVIKSYVLNVKNMTGQPYNYTGGNEQHAIFPIDSEHLLSIDSISVFCQDFPNQLSEDQAPIDIVVSNFKIEFYDELSESEIQGISLRITTPYGGFFYQRGSNILPISDDGENPGIRVDAVLRIKGKRVNPDQKVSYYWFVRDDKIQTDSDEGYHRYGGTGWRCINSQYQTVTSGDKTGYIANKYSIYIPYSECPAYQNYIKCTAVFEQDSNMTVIDTEKIVYNTLVVDNNNIYIESMMGTVFNFNTGLTTLTCKFKNTEGIYPEDYAYLWTRSIDGREREAIVEEKEGKIIRVTSKKLSGVNIGLASSFVIYSCSVYENYGKDNETFIGAAEITLSNEIVQGEYKLVLHNGTQVFKYDAKGVSPASPSVDEQSRLDLGAYALSFDIYDDKGQRIDMGSDENKHRIIDIKWIWPSTNFDVAPDLQRTDFESMLLPEELNQSESAFELETIPSPYNPENEIKRWIRKDQANLSYQIQSRYDSNKINNNIQLEITYKGYILTASTNFTFTKEGELGTNGTKYIARIRPRNSDYQKIMIINNGFYALDKENRYRPLQSGILNDNFIVEIWDGGVTPVTTSDSLETKVEWTTVRKDRGLDSDPDNITSFLYVQLDKQSEKPSMQLIATNNKEQNHTLKAKVTNSSLLQQPFYCEYPLEYYLNSDYIIQGGYKYCNYESDGTRADFSTNGFKLISTSSSIVDSNIKWKTNWNGDKYTVQIKLDENTNNPIPLYKVTSEEINGYNNVVLEAPAYFEGKNIDNYVSCRYKNKSDEDYQLVAVIPISLYLNKFGLSAINGWDGTSIKLNETGDNYILAPQMGAGIRETEESYPGHGGAFTGIITGKSIENNKDKMGLFGYYGGERSIFLDAQTGDATFGKADGSQIQIKANGSGYIQSGDYNWAAEGGTGARFQLSSANGSGPYIRFGSQKFSVNSNGELTAKGGGSIAGWEITFNVLKNNNLILDSGGKIAGGTDGKVSFTDSDGNTYTNKRWKIESNGVATFSDIEITNDTSKTTQASDKKLIDIKKGDDTKFSVDNEGSLLAASANVTGTITAQLGNIGGWTIDDTGIHRDSFYLNNIGGVQLGEKYSFTDAGGSGTAKNNNITGSSIGSGDVYGGYGEGSGKSSQWQEVRLVNDVITKQVTLLENIRGSKETGYEGVPKTVDVIDTAKGGIKGNRYLLLVQEY